MWAVLFVTTEEDQFYRTLNFASYHLFSSLLNKGNILKVTNLCEKQEGFSLNILCKAFVSLSRSVYAGMNAALGVMDGLISSESSSH